MTAVFDVKRRPSSATSPSISGKGTAVTQNSSGCIPQPEMPGAHGDAVQDQGDIVGENGALLAATSARRPMASGPWESSRNLRVDRLHSDAGQQPDHTRSTPMSERYGERPHVAVSKGWFQDARRDAYAPRTSVAPVRRNNLCALLLRPSQDDKLPEDCIPSRLESTVLALPLRPVSLLEESDRASGSRAGPQRP